MSLLRNAARFVLLCPLALVAAAQVPNLPLKSKPAATAPIPLPPPNPAAPAQLTAQDVTAFLDGFLPLQLQRDDVAGATISITHNGEPLILKGYGYADWKKKTPVNPVTTTFRPASISKLFVYVSMMQLVEQGKLDLDVDVSRYLDFPIYPGPGSIGNAAITLRHLATHTSGFEEVVHDLGSDKSGKLPADLRTFLVRDQPHRFAAPGNALAYSNYGITMIGYIVQRVSGEAFSDYAQRHIFTPLGMTHTTFLQPLPLGFESTHGYLTTSKPDTGFEGWTPYPSGGSSTTAADMALFGQMILGHGTFNGHTILQPSSVATLLAPQFTPAPGVVPWNLGFYTLRRNGLDFIGHGGDLLACHSEFWVEPTHGLTFFISYNSAGARGVARQELFNALVDRYLPGPAAPHPAYLKLTLKDLAPYSGAYLSSRRNDSTKFRLLNDVDPREVSAKLDDDKNAYLVWSSLKDFHHHPMRFHPIGNDSFYEEDEQLTIHFERDAHGHIAGYATPGHSDRASLLVSPNVLMPLLIGSLATLLAVCLAILVRGWRRIFHRRRASLAPQPGTIWLTSPMKLASVACVAVGLWLIAILLHTEAGDNFWLFAHLDRWFIMQNILTVLALIAIFFGVVSGLKAIRRPLRPITRVKFAVVNFALIYCAWVMVYFHFIGSTHRY